MQHEGKRLPLIRLQLGRGEEARRLGLLLWVHLLHRLQQLLAGPLLRVGCGGRRRATRQEGRQRSGGG